MEKYLHARALGDLEGDGLAADDGTHGEVERWGWFVWEWMNAS
jgi:hypothetical protein